MTGPDLKHWREAQGLTPQALAVLLGCDWRSVYKWEAGERKIMPMVEAHLKRLMAEVKHE